MPTELQSQEIAVEHKEKVAVDIKCDTYYDITFYKEVEARYAQKTAQKTTANILKYLEKYPGASREKLAKELGTTSDVVKHKIAQLKGWIVRMSRSC